MKENCYIKKMEVKSGDVHSLNLSSKSIENEQANVRQYMKYANGFFAFSGVGNGTAPSRFYPTLNEAYKETLTQCMKIQKKSNSEKNKFRISDGKRKVLFEGRITPSNKIIFSIYKGKEEKVISTIDKEINNLTIKKEKDMRDNSNSTVNVVRHNEFKNNDMAMAISSGATVYLEKKVLTQASVNFLCLSEDCAKSIAQSVQDTAIANKDADNQSFIEAIAKASSNMVCITKTLASGKPIDGNHVSFHNDLLYCASHCKSKESLFDGSNTWKKVPGKIAYHKICDSIMDMYYVGQKMLLATDGTETSVNTVPMQKETIVPKKTINDVAKAITAVIMTHLRPSEDILYYLEMKNTTFDSDMESLSHGVMSGTINDDKITLKIQSGQSKEISLSGYSTDEQLRITIRKNVSQLFVCASISNKTRDMVATHIDLSSVEEYYFNSQMESQSFATVDVPAATTDGMGDNNNQIELYNKLIAEQLCGIVDMDSNIKSAYRRHVIGSFLRQCAEKSGLPCTDMPALIDLISDSFYKELIMEYIDNLPQQKYSQVA